MLICVYNSVSGFAMGAISRVQARYHANPEILPIALGILTAAAVCYKLYRENGQGGSIVGTKPQQDRSSEAVAETMIKYGHPIDKLPRAFARFYRRNVSMRVPCRNSGIIKYKDRRSEDALVFRVQLLKGDNESNGLFLLFQERAGRWNIASGFSAQELVRSGIERNCGPKKFLELLFSKESPFKLEPFQAGVLKLPAS